MEQFFACCFSAWGEQSFQGWVCSSKMTDGLLFIDLEGIEW